MRPEPPSSPAAAGTPAPAGGRGPDTDTTPAFTARRIGEMDAAFSGHFIRARAALGVQAFGLSIVQLPASSDHHSAHDHAQDHHEEVYLALSGSATLLIDAEAVDLDTETLVRVSWPCRRQIIAGPRGVRVLIIGGRAGQPYRPPPFSELGAPDQARRSGPEIASREP